MCVCVRERERMCVCVVHIVYVRQGMQSSMTTSHPFLFVSREVLLEQRSRAPPRSPSTMPTTLDWIMSASVREAHRRPEVWTSLRRTRTRTNLRYRHHRSCQHVRISHVLRTSKLHYVSCRRARHYPFTTRCVLPLPFSPTTFPSLHVTLPGDFTSSSPPKKQ